MTIWLLAVLLVASVAALGYRQGAIRVSFSLVAITLGALLAAPLGALVRPLLKLAGVQNPLYLYILPPFIVFILISIAFKVGAQSAHHKADVFYKYKAGDLRLALWERLNARLGLCLGVLNGVLYCVLLAFVLHTASYVTVQFASTDGDPRWMRVLNYLGKDLESSGMYKVSGAFGMPKSWYDAADLGAVIYQNPLVEARLARYPAFLGISERPEFKDLGGDRDFTEMRLKRAPVMDVANHSKAQTIVQNPETLTLLWGILKTDMGDLSNYLRTGISAKYDQESIVGRWLFEPRLALAAKRRAKPNMTSRESTELRRWFEAAFAQTSLVAMVDRQALLKNLPSLRVPPATQPPAPIQAGTQLVQGQWNKTGAQYLFTFSGGAEAPATVEGDRLRLNYEGTELVFSKEQ